MHIYTVLEVALMAERLMNEGMAAKDAVNIASTSYGFTTDEIYVCMTVNNIGGQGNG